MAHFNPTGCEDYCCWPCGGTIELDFCLNAIVWTVFSENFSITPKGRVRGPSGEIVESVEYWHEGFVRRQEVIEEGPGIYTLEVACGNGNFATVGQVEIEEENIDEFCNCCTNWRMAAKDNNVRYDLSFTESMSGFSGSYFSDTWTFTGGFNPVRFCRNSLSHFFYQGKTPVEIVQSEAAVKVYENGGDKLWVAPTVMLGFVNLDEQATNWWERMRLWFSIEWSIYTQGFGTSGDPRITWNQRYKPYYTNFINLDYDTLLDFKGTCPRKIPFSDQYTYSPRRIAWFEPDNTLFDIELTNGFTINFFLAVSPA